MRRATNKTETAINALLACDTKPKEPSPQTKPLTITVSEACRLSGLGPTTIWKFIRDGRLDIVRVAGIKRTLIIYDGFTRMLIPACPSSRTPRKRRARLAGTVSPKSTMEVA
jgi:excisionase family DNA binding protein